MIKRIIMSLIFPLILFAGCFDYDQTMVINKDGSGAVSVRYAVEKAYLEQIRQMNQAMAEQSGKTGTIVDPAETMFSKSEIEKTLKESESGIRMLSYERSETNDSRIWEMEFSFADINKLSILADALSSDSEQYGQPSDDRPIYELQTDGTWLYSQPFMEGDEAAEEGSEDEEYEDRADEDLEEGEMGELGVEEESAAMEEWSQDMKDLAQSMAEHRIRVSVEFPGEVVESNATSVEGKKAVWEYTLEKMPEAPENLRAIIRP